MIDLKFYIAGMQFRPKEEIAKAIQSIKVDDELILRCEPTNKFDLFAVRILAFIEDHNFFIGYVPKKFSAQVTQALNMDTKLTCTVSKIDTEAQTWAMCEVRIVEG